MSRCITRKELEIVADRINRVTNNPIDPWGDNGSNVGTYYISGAYGGYNLEQIVNEQGGCRSVLRCGHISARELYYRMQAYLQGYEEAKESKCSCSY